MKIIDVHLAHEDLRLASATVELGPREVAFLYKVVAAFSKAHADDVFNGASDAADTLWFGLSQIVNTVYEDGISDLIDQVQS